MKTRANFGGTLLKLTNCEEAKYDVSSSCSSSAASGMGYQDINDFVTEESPISFAKNKAPIVLLKIRRKLCTDSFEEPLNEAAYHSPLLRMPNLDLKKPCFTEPSQDQIEDIFDTITPRETLAQRVLLSAIGHCPARCDIVNPYLKV